MSVKWNGMDEFTNSLIRVPIDLLPVANGIVQNEAYLAAFEIRQEYGRHVVTGNLRDHVTVKQRATARGDIVFQVRSTGFLAFIFEYGSEARHYITVNGVKKAVGRMPAFKVVSRIAPRRRRSMFLRLRDLVAKSGFRVVGDVAA